MNPQARLVAPPILDSRRSFFSLDAIDSWRLFSGDDFTCGQAAGANAATPGRAFLCAGVCVCVCVCVCLCHFERFFTGPNGCPTYGAVQLLPHASKPRMLLQASLWVIVTAHRFGQWLPPFQTNACLGDSAGTRLAGDNARRLSGIRLETVKLPGGRGPADHRRASVSFVPEEPVP